MTGKVSIQRLPSGIPGFDAVLGGGVPEFSFNVIAGPPGAGKTTLVHQMMFALARPDRRALFFTVLGESPLKMLRYQQQFTFFDVAKMKESVRFINLAEEVRGGLAVVLQRIVNEVEAALTGTGVTVVMTAELEDSYADRRLSPHATAFLTDAIILQRYVEVDGHLQRVMAVVKLRGSDHSKDLRFFEAISDGIVVGERIEDWQGFLTGSPRVASPETQRSPRRRRVSAGGRRR